MLWIRFFCSVKRKFHIESAWICNNNNAWEATSPSCPALPVLVLGGREPVWKFYLQLATATGAGGCHQLDNLGLLLLSCPLIFCCNSYTWPVSSLLELCGLSLSKRRVACGGCSALPVGRSAPGVWAGGSWRQVLVGFQRSWATQLGMEARVCHRWTTRSRLRWDLWRVGATPYCDCGFLLWLLLVWPGWSVEVCPGGKAQQARWKLSWLSRSLRSGSWL